MKPNWFDYFRAILFLIGTLCIIVFLCGAFKQSIMLGFSLIGIYQVSIWVLKLVELIGKLLLKRTSERMLANG